MAEAAGARHEHPDTAEVHLRRGAYLAEAGDLEGAVAAYRQALALDPASCQAWNNLGLIFASLGDRATALIFFREALKLEPQFAEIHNNLGNIYLADKDIDAALLSYAEAIALKPASAAYRNHYGTALRQAGRFEEAEAVMRTALELDPGYAEASANLASLLVEMDRMREAEELYRRAIALKPDVAVAHVYLAMLLLRSGCYSEGWREQEWRWRWKEFPSPKRAFEQPLWTGEPIRGQRILLHAEQGLGDAIQFLRYVPMVTALGATVILEVHPELQRLAQSVHGVARVIARGEQIPECDLHCPLLSLPLAFATEVETIPADIPYLFAEVLTPALPARPGKLRVGLVWAGDPKSPVDWKRSLNPASLALLFAIDQVEIYSLQRGAAGEQGAALPFTGTLAQDGDFAVTANVMATLDLVLSVDTAVAHLGGALGKPVWILLPKVADWRWLSGRDDSPWYPTARLFRQQTAGDWDGVIARVHAELTHLARNR